MNRDTGPLSDPLQEEATIPLAESETEENPLIKLPPETARFVGYLKNNIGKERAPDEQGLSLEMLGARRLIESMSSYGWVPEGFDRDRYVALVGKVQTIESLLPRANPSVAVEEAGLLLRGRQDKVRELESLRAELESMDSQLTAKLGITPENAQSHVKHPNIGEHIGNYEKDKKARGASMERAAIKKHAKISAGLEIEKSRGVKKLEIPEHIRGMLERVRSGNLEVEELSPLPPKGMFELLQDVGDPDRTIPAKIYERQIVRTNRDVTSPGFSGCASVLLYREGADGHPEPESIFAHLPPQGDRGFESYDADFWQEQANITDLTGYKAKVIAGLVESPEEIAHSLKKMGADVVAVEQIPLEMYTVLVDATTKSLVASGELEVVADDPSMGYYKTKGGKVPIRKESATPGLTYIE